ncbi:hypothetical protein HPT27_06380 [Permianibacter sp. IMCC34836]|nr:hypothetical protein [Permianibacter fluminis]
MAQLSRLRSDRKVEAMAEGLRANPSLMKSAELHLNLMAGAEANAKLKKSYRTNDGGDVWIGDVQTLASKKNGAVSNGDQAILVQRNGLVTGNVRLNGKLYSIRPLSNGDHVVTKIDESQLPPDHPEGEYRSIFDSAQRQFNAQRSQMNKGITTNAVALANSTIRLLVNYTQGAAAAVTDISSMIDLAVAESNQGYVNSGINITFELAAKSQVTYTESTSITTDRDRYAGKTDGYMDSIHSQRDSVAADVGVLILNNSEACGIAKAIGATESTAFAVVHYDCATGYYSFAHEIGHLQGARHDPANDPTTTPYAYGHGYQAPNKAWRTVMAYNCSPSCTRINYWSNPNKTYSDGQAMGTASQSDNVRVLNATAATVAAFRGGTPPPSESYSNTADYNIPDNNATGIQSPISVPTSGTAGTVTVDVNIVHPYIGDLIVDLIAPDGSVYNLQNRSGGSADNIVKTFTVSGASAEQKNGSWKLRAADRASADTGYINSWTLKFN